MFKHENGGAPTDLSGLHVQVRRRRNTHLEMRERQGETVSADIRSVRETRVYLPQLCPEAKQPEHSSQLIPQFPVTAVSRPCVARTAMRVVTFRIILPGPSRRPSAAPTSARTALWIERY